MPKYTVTVCTTMGHLLELTHSPQTLESAKRWAEELASLPGIRNVIISENSSRNLAVLEGSHSGAWG